MSDAAPMVYARSPDEVASLMDELLPTGHGLRVLHVKPDQVGYTAGPDGLMPALGGSVSGPSIFRVVDFAAFATLSACVRTMPSAVLAQSSLSFLDAAELDVLEVVIQIEKVGFKSAVVSARVTDNRGQLVAIGMLHFALPSPRPRAPGQRTA